MRCLLLLVFACTSVQHPRATSEGPAPAIPAVLAAFDRYEIVAINAGHGKKDLDDFLLALVRDPHLPDVVNDIAVECGNSLYQPVLDRYIAGEDVPFVEVRKVWRNTTQTMCGTSTFYEALFPLVRAINRRLPANKRLRVLAGDPPIDWDAVKTADDVGKFFMRDEPIAAVMKTEVLAKHRKALMLFGTFHLMHGQGGNAVSLYEKTYPGVTFVISDLGNYDTTRFASSHVPSLLPTKDTPLGAASPSEIWTPPVRIRNCKVEVGFAPELQKPVAEVVDAFLYLGPRDVRLAEPTPADVALDTAYMTELLRRDALSAFPGEPTQTLDDLHAALLQEGERPFLEAPPPPPDAKAVEQECRAHQQDGPH